MMYSVSKPYCLTLVVASFTFCSTDGGSVDLREAHNTVRAEEKCDALDLCRVMLFHGIGYYSLHVMVWAFKEQSKHTSLRAP